MIRLLARLAPLFVLCGLAQAQIPGCLPSCTLQSNTFPKVETSSDGGTLSEALPCSGGVGSCVVTGTVSWTPMRFCCASSGNWDATGSSSCGSFVQCTTTLAKNYFTACTSGGSVSPPSCSSACSDTYFGVEGTIMDCSCGILTVNSVQFTAQKLWECN